jgi:hypothetical protein
MEDHEEEDIRQPGGCYANPKNCNWDIELLEMFMDTFLYLFPKQANNNKEEEVQENEIVDSAPGIMKDDNLWNEEQAMMHPPRSSCRQQADPIHCKSDLLSDSFVRLFPERGYKSEAIAVVTRTTTNHNDRDDQDAGLRQDPEMDKDDNRLI